MSECGCKVGTSAFLTLILGEAGVERLGRGGVGALVALCCDVTHFGLCLIGYLPSDVVVVYIWSICKI